MTPLMAPEAPTIGMLEPGVITTCSSAAASPQTR